MRLLGRAFSSSYFAGEAAARTLPPARLPGAPPIARARTRAAAGGATSPAVVEILRAQQAALAAQRGARRRRSTRWPRGGTAVVVTGQQVGLFLGPLYGFYKAASAVAVARALEAEAGVRCVPLFWLQTEDHDFAEIASVTVATAGGAAPCGSRSPTTRPARRAPRSPHRRLGADVTALLGGARPRPSAPAPAAAETVALLGRHYRPGRADRGGLRRGDGRAVRRRGAAVLRSARRGASPRLAAPLHRRALAAAHEVERRLDGRRAALGAAGFDEQIPVRPGCALSFFHPDGPAGDRFRLARRADSPGAWGLSGRDGRRVRRRARGGARARAAPLLDLGAAAPDPAGQPAPDRGLRGRARRGELLRAARPALRRSSS